MTTPLIPWTNTDQSVPARTFVNFGQLPLELRSTIWKSWVKVPRLVRWGPGGGKPPNYRQVNRESRQETEGGIQVIRPLKYLPSNKWYELNVNFEVDLLYRKSKLPSIPFPVPPQGWFGARLQYPITARPSLPHLEWLQPCKYFAINIDDLAAHNGSTWHKLAAILPNLKELSVVCYDSPSKLTTLEDLVPVLAFTANQSTLSQTVLNDLEYHRTFSVAGWPALASLELKWVKKRS